MNKVNIFRLLCLCCHKLWPEYLHCTMILLLLCEFYDLRKIDTEHGKMGWRSILLLGLFIHTAAWIVHRQWRCLSGPCLEPGSPAPSRDSSNVTLHGLIKLGIALLLLINGSLLIFAWLQRDKLVQFFCRTQGCYTALIRLAIPAFIWVAII